MVDKRTTRSSFDGFAVLLHPSKRVLLLPWSSPSTLREAHPVDAASAFLPGDSHTLNQRDSPRPVPTVGCTGHGRGFPNPVESPATPIPTQSYPHQGSFGSVFR